MKNAIKIAYILLSGALLLSSCTKEGPVGPQGPQGEQGPEGEKGDAGVVNIIYSSWAHLSFSKNANGYFVATINAPQLTRDILDKGEVAVYGKYDVYVYKLPDFGVGDDYVMINYLKAGEIHLISDHIPGWLFRYVLIPGGVAASARSSLSGPDLNDYHAVCQYYNILE